MAWKQRGARAELLSSMGTSFEILKKISDGVRLRGGSDEDLREILRNPALADNVADLIWRRGGEERFDVAFPDDTTGSELLRLGHFDQVDTAVLAHFCARPKGMRIKGGCRMYARFFHDRGVSKTPSEARDRIKERGWRPATPQEFLFFTAASNAWPPLRGSGHFVVCLDKVPIPPTVEEGYGKHQAETESSGHLFARYFGQGTNKGMMSFLTVLSASDLHQPWHYILAVEPEEKT